MWTFYVIFICIGLWLLQYPIKWIAKFLEGKDVKKYIFHFIFALIAGVLGFIIMNNGIGGKIGGALLFFFLGLPIAWLLDVAITWLFRNRVLIIIIQIILLIVFSCFAVTRNYGTASRGGDGVHTCRNCGRDTDLVAGFGYCYTCYKGFNEWQKDYYD